jgi:osomolarity two-component system response regulator SKN7
LLEGALKMTVNGADPSVDRTSHTDTSSPNTNPSFNAYSGVDLTTSDLTSRLLAAAAGLAPSANDAQRTFSRHEALANLEELQARQRARSVTGFSPTPAAIAVSRPAAATAAGSRFSQDDMSGDASLGDAYAGTSGDGLQSRERSGDISSGEQQQQQQQQVLQRAEDDLSGPLWSRSDIGAVVSGTMGTDRDAYPDASFGHVFPRAGDGGVGVWSIDASVGVSGMPDGGDGDVFSCDGTPDGVTNDLDDRPFIEDGVSSASTAVGRDAIQLSGGDLVALKPASLSSCADGSSLQLFRQPSLQMQLDYLQELPGPSRSPSVPPSGWAVPPRVLVVEDDVVNRMLSSKFLKVFGCNIDVAVDGLSAVQKMNIGKYDLVLMDIMMPRLDGIKATSLIRQFDPRTPIISMTSNSQPTEIMAYFSSGMNDILPKPFTKEGLREMLEKHLVHLRIIQRQKAKLPRPVMMPSSSDGFFDDTLAVQVTNGDMAESGSCSATASTSNELMCEVDGVPSDFLSLTDEQYDVLLRSLVAGQGPLGFMTDTPGLGFNLTGEKRSLEDPTDTRKLKKSRFEVLE